MSDDLVKRLREPLSQLPGDDDTLMERVVSDRDEAAQALTEARAEIERQATSLAELNHDSSAMADEIQRLETERALQERRAIAAESELSALRARVREVVGPLARLRVPEKPQGNAGAYSIFHNDIRAARQLMEELKDA